VPRSHAATALKKKSETGKDTNMNNKLDQYCGLLKEEIKIAEAHLKQVGRHVESVGEDGMEILETRLKEAEAKCEVSRKKADEAAGRIKEFLEEKIDSAVTKLEDWKTDRDIEKVEKRADRKEQYAIDLMVLATFAVQGAEVALVDALAARKFATEVAG
jgi:hypothetical protein